MKVYCPVSQLHVAVVLSAADRLNKIKMNKEFWASLDSLSAFRETLRPATIPKSQWRLLS